MLNVKLLKNVGEVWFPIVLFCVPYLMVDVCPRRCRCPRDRLESWQSGLCRAVRGID